MRPNTPAVAWLRTGGSAMTEHLSGAAAGDLSRRALLAVPAGSLAAGFSAPLLAAGPDGQLTWAIHVSLAPVWFDPGEVSGIITPFMVLYALHDAMVKPMPGQALAPSLAETVSAAEDGLTYDF